MVGEGEDTQVAPVGGAQLGLPVHYLEAHILTLAMVQSCKLYTETMERLHMEAQDGLKTIAPPLFLNIFFYFLLV